MTREKVFTVPENKMFELAEIIEENSLIAQILGTDEEEAITLRIKYDSSHHSAIMAIIELLDDEDEEEQE